MLPLSVASLNEKGRAQNPKRKEEKKMTKEQKLFMEMYIKSNLSEVLDEANENGYEVIGVGISSEEYIEGEELDSSCPGINADSLETTDYICLDKDADFTKYSLKHIAIIAGDWKVNTPVEGEISIHNPVVYKVICWKWGN